MRASLCWQIPAAASPAETGMEEKSALGERKGVPQAGQGAVAVTDGSRRSSEARFGEFLRIEHFSCCCRRSDDPHGAFFKEKPQERLLAPIDLQEKCFHAAESGA